MKVKVFGINLLLRQTKLMIFLQCLSKWMIDERLTFCNELGESIYKQREN